MHLLPCIKFEGQGLQKREFTNISNWRRFKNLSFLSWWELTNQEMPFIWWNVKQVLEDCVKTVLAWFFSTLSLKYLNYYNPLNGLKNHLVCLHLHFTQDLKQIWWTMMICSLTLLRAGQVQEFSLFKFPEISSHRKLLLSVESTCGDSEVEELIWLTKDGRPSAKCAADFKFTLEKTVSRLY